MTNPFLDTEARASQKRATTARHAGMKYLIEGEYVNMQEIAARLGVTFDCARMRHQYLCKKPGNITWAKLGEHR